MCGLKITSSRIRRVGERITDERSRRALEPAHQLVKIIASGMALAVLLAGGALGACSGTEKPRGRRLPDGSRVGRREDTREAESGTIPAQLFLRLVFF